MTKKSSTTTPPGTESRRQFEAITARIDQRFKGAQARHLHALHELMLVRAPYSPLLEASVDKVVDVLEFGVTALAGRRETVHVEVLPGAPGAKTLLATCTPDVPFLLSSLLVYLHQENVHQQVLGHPIFVVERSGGRLESVLPLDESGPRESLILLELDFVPEGLDERLCDDIREILTRAHTVAHDQPAMRGLLQQMPGRSGLETYQEFADWLENENFYRFAYRCLEVSPGGEARRVEAPLGVLPDDADDALPGDVARLPRPLRAWLRRDDPVLVEQTPWPSPLYRDEPLVYLGFREQLADGGFREHGFYGLFTPLSVDEPSFDVPYLRLKIEAALETMEIPAGSYDRRLSVEILNTFPKVELFLMSAEELCRVIRSFLSLQRRDSVRVVTARRLSLEGLALLVVMPKEFFNSDNRRRMENYLRRAFRSKTAEVRLIHVYGEFSSTLVRLQPKGKRREVDTYALEGVLTRLLQSWDIKLLHALERLSGLARGQSLWHTYHAGFELDYRRMVHPRYAARDILAIDGLFGDGRARFALWGPRPGTRDFVLQFYALTRSYLNALMPLLENLGLCVVEEVDFNVRVGERAAYLKSFVLHDRGDACDVGSLRGKLLETLDALWHGTVENDYLHLLQLKTGLDWQQVDVFRGYRNYYFQLGSPFTKKRVAFALVRNPAVARLLYDYFEARFDDRADWNDPEVREEQALMPLRMQLLEALEQVGDVNEDRILRTFFNLIDSTVRTNFFVRRGRDDYFFAFKISALGIIDMPFPRPSYEIYVHSATMEGIHLRGGLVARGGIRWSDRPDDFRTEILGLMKTQMTKNTVIVPVGSKGGFVVKTPYSSREEGGELSRQAYVTLMRGLLDLTDNRVAGDIVHPERLVCYDGDDPYLVVAADKGTAHLPDTANGVSAAYRFWLGDAFASGGSHGYDHKKLGITARGAWESVKRHFRELGRDIQNQPFTAVGIGDMSGDVFGNGMLLSPQTRLRAAFDHRHIFLDPDPDPETSFRERQRLFDTPRSSWDDYDRELISKGGGVWPRSSKDIPLSAEVRAWLGIRHTSLDGEGLIRLLLSAETDLLWNGGIGTYVKASTEKNEDAGDRANDAVRVDASQLRALVVGEGGNLGFTQRARIEYALAGGRINTDAIDNSAGVDTSDHEVNLKILMQHLLESGRLRSEKQRNGLLERLTDEVSAMVLNNNYTQSLSLALDELRCRVSPERFFDLADRLVNAGLLDRQGEFLPGRKEVLARDPVGYTRPELSILLAYTKMHVFTALLESDLPEQPRVQALLDGYFPTALRKDYGDEIRRHPLAREIVATVINNRVVDQGGSTLVHALARETGAGLAEAVDAYLSFESLLEAGKLRDALFALDNRIHAETQYELLILLEDGLRDLCRWQLENRQAQNSREIPEDDLRVQLTAYLKELAGILPDHERQRAEDFERRMLDAGVPRETLAPFVALLHIQDFLPLVILARHAGVDLYSAAVTLMDVRRSFEIGFLAEIMARVPLRDHWDRVAARDLARTLEEVAYRMVEQVLVDCSGNLETFVNRRRRRIAAYRDLCARLRATTPVNLHPLAVSIHALQELLAD